MGNQELAARLRGARREARLTQMELARRLGKSQSFVSLAESGKAVVGERYVSRVIEACQLVSGWGAAEDPLVNGTKSKLDPNDFAGLDPETLQLVVRGSERDEELRTKYVWWDRQPRFE